PSQVPFAASGSYDKPSFAIDSTNDIYLVALQTFTGPAGDPRHGLVIARSQDAGQSFSVPITFAPNNLILSVGHPPVAVDRGPIVVPFFEVASQNPDAPLRNNRLWALVLESAATLETHPYLVAESVAGVFPFLTVDPSRGRLYIAWTGPKEDRNIYLARSDDRGRTWSRPVRVNSSESPTRNKRY